MSEYGNWIAISLWDVLLEEGIVVSHVMEPYRKWCKENIGPQWDRDNKNLVWWNDLAGVWYKIHFKKPEDAAAFILMSGGKKVYEEI